MRQAPRSRDPPRRHGYFPVDGWGARIRTWEWRYQKPLPYHLATPQLRRCLAKAAEGCKTENRSFCTPLSYGFARAGGRGGTLGKGASRKQHDASLRQGGWSILPQAGCGKRVAALGLPGSIESGRMPSHSDTVPPSEDDSPGEGPRRRGLAPLFACPDISGFRERVPPALKRAGAYAAPNTPTGFS